MSDLRRSFHERSNLWGSFKKRLSGSSIRRTSIIGQEKTPKECKAAEESHPMASTRRTERTQTHRQEEPQTCRRSEGDRRLGATVRTEIATKSTPVTCLPTRPNQTSAGGFSSLFFCTSVQKFAQLDDDTFSTKPNVGLAARYNKRDYSDVWLAEDSKSEEVEDKKGFGGYNSSTSRKKDPNTGSSSRFNSKKKTLLIPSTKKDNILTPRNIGILEKEISRLTSVLNKSMMDRTSYPPKRDPNNVYDDYADEPTEIAATDTDVSTSTGSGFSFRADFSHVVVGETTSRSGVVLEECKREQEKTPASSTGAKIETPTEFVSSGGILPLLHPEPMQTEITPTTNVQENQEDMSKQIELPTKVIQDAVRIFQPILAESTHNDGIYEHDNPAWGVRDLLETSVRYNNTDISATVPGAKQKAQSIFRTSRQVAGRNWHKYYHEKQTFDEKDHQSILRHIDESCVGETIGGDSIGIQEICFSQDESQLMSEMTDTFSAQDKNEISYDGYVNDRNNNAQRKAKCVVFHNPHLFHESDHRLMTSNVTVKVKEVITKFEALKRMEIDHSDKYFLPIAETHEAAYASYEETAKEHFNAEGINWVGSESFSLE